jgi:phosphoglycerol transferase MdoB-like AlkP superfamily enzyme
MAVPQHVLVAGVPWPWYKLIAVVAGLAALLIAGVLTSSAAPSVLAAAAVAGVVVLVFMTRD